MDALAISIAEEPTGQYLRKIWFLYEWLMETYLNLPDLDSANYTDLVDTTIQYGYMKFVKNPKRISALW